MIIFVWLPKKCARVGTCVCVCARARVCVCERERERERERDLMREGEGEEKNTFFAILETQQVIMSLRIQISDS